MTAHADDRPDADQPDAERADADRADAPRRDAWVDPGAHAVAPGVHRIPLPLPGDALKAVNVYAIDTDVGVTLVDAGWALAQARTLLEDGLAAIGHDLGEVTQFLVTHLHRDHYELAITIRRLFGTTVRLGRGEQPSLAALLDDGDGDEPLLGRLHAAGASNLADHLRRVHDRERATIGWEAPDTWLDDGEVVDLGGRHLTVVATPGHTNGHVVYVDADAGLLFSGDHVLPHITPSIGFEAVPTDTALVDYLRSLARVRALPDLRMLPAHGPTQPTTHDRVGQLQAHHDERLAQSLAAMADGGTTAMEVAGRLGWTRRATPFADLDLFNQTLAVNETLAHLDALVHQGRATRTDDADGTRVFAAA